MSAALLMTSWWGGYVAMKWSLGPCTKQALLAVAQEKPAQTGSQTHSLISHMTVDPDLDTTIHYGSLPSLY